jgi:hypothetical protein
MDEPFRIGQPRWRQLDKGRRVVDVSIEWGQLPPALEKEVRRNALAVGKALVERRMDELQAQLDALRADVQAMSEMLEEDEDGPPR